MKFQIELLTEDKNTRELCTAYWEMDTDGNFTHSLANLAERFHIGQVAITSAAKKNCRAFPENRFCKQCQKPTVYVDNRKKAQTVWLNAKPDYCKKCQQEKDEQVQLQTKEQSKLQVELKAEISRKEKEDKMLEAVEDGRLHSLKTLQFNFLAALASCESISEARRKIGISQKYAAQLIDELHKLHLLNYDAETDSCHLLNELTTLLQNDGLKRKVKSVFGSSKNLDLYRRLKKELPFVFPEMPMSAFIEKSQVEHLFTEEWHFSYFLKARIDCVACDSEGIPYRAFEYQGGHHKDGEQTKKDDFKKLILEEVGLPLREVTSQDWKHFK
jgi:hypothetical protein